MKHYLLTWYGMTDLRAALGFEDTGGPVLSALKTGDYSDAVILAYTNPSKDQSAFDGGLRKEWKEWVTIPKAQRPTLSRDQVHRFVDALSNTVTGYELFTEWLQNELKPLGVIAKLHVIPQELKHLNDARGIHSAATAAVRVALNDAEIKQVTTYVSPGTPVMAYTWALIARSNPQLNIGVVSGSDPRQPPERIELPKALLDSAISVNTSFNTEAREYDLVIHLLGEQTMPIFFGLRQFTADQHVVVTTRDYLDEVARLSTVSNVSPNATIIADPFKPADTRRAIISLTEGLPPETRIAVNMTGGTKLMFAGALSACWELGLDPFYFEIRNHNVIFLRDGSQVPFVGISDVEDFLRAGDHRTVSHGRWPVEMAAIKNVRQRATAEMWQRRDALRSLYQDKEFQAFNNSYNRHMPPHERDALPFNFTWRSGEASLSESGATKLILRGTEVPLPKKGYFRFLSGGWLEEYVYSVLQPLQHEGLIHDVRVGLEVGFRQVVAAKHEAPAQEFDCSFTDGKRLWIVECKAGQVKQDAIQKLENNLRQYGGIAARGLLVSGLPLIEANQSRVDSIPAISAVHPDHLTTETLRLIIQTA